MIPPLDMDKNGLEPEGNYFIFIGGWFCVRTRD